MDGLLEVVEVVGCSATTTSCEADVQKVDMLERDERRRHQSSSGSASAPFLACGWREETGFRVDLGYKGAYRNQYEKRVGSIGANRY
jgi:hypothetical protein